jgi:hypothetical protein
MDKGPPGTNQQSLAGLLQAVKSQAAATVEISPLHSPCRVLSVIACFHQLELLKKNRFSVADRNIQWRAGGGGRRIALLALNRGLSLIRGARAVRQHRRTVAEPLE